MSIANELSNDIARAVLERAATAAESGDKSLTAIVLEVHSTLRRLTKEARQRRLSQLSPAPSFGTSAASGAH